jgi:integrase
MKLTMREIERHTPEGKDQIVFDEELSGFGLRFRGSKRTWVFQYSFGGGTNRVNARMTLGEYPALPPAKAREIAQDLYAKVRLGQHPAADKRVSRTAAQNTFGRLVSGYLEFQKGETRLRTYVEIERYLNQHARALHGLLATAIDRKKIADLLDTIAKNSGAVSANRLRSALSAMFSWAMRKGLHDGINPVASTEKRRERTRDRVLSDDELRLIWNALGPNDYGDILRLLILTGQRGGEVSGLRWKEIDFDENVIALPAARTKNGEPHSIPMSGPVREILKARTPTRDLVFGRGTGGFNSWNGSKVRLDAEIKLPDWTTHDLRRTFATGLQRLGIRLEVTEAILNHVGGNRSGVGGIYRRYDWATEKRTALNAWAVHVLDVVSGKKRKGNVTPLRA